MEMGKAAFFDACAADFALRIRRNRVERAGAES